MEILTFLKGALWIWFKAAQLKCCCLSFDNVLWIVYIIGMKWGTDQTSRIYIAHVCNIFRDMPVD